MLCLLTVLLAFTGAFAQPTAPAPSPGFPTCYICGNSSYTIANPNANVTFPGQGPITCGSLYTGGLTGFIDAAYCPVVRGFKGLKACGCTISGVAPSAPTAPTPAPAVVPCNICGKKSYRVFQPDVVLTIPGSAPITCGDLETDALAGGLTPNECQGLTAVGVASECDCRLCRDPPTKPIPVDPLSVNKTCVWLAGHFNQLVVDSKGLTVDASFFGDQTWGDYLCRDLELAYTAYDICRVTCGSCNPHCSDDVTGKTFDAGKFGKQTCKWLSANPRNWNKFCNVGSKPAAALCPYTCNTCP